MIEVKKILVIEPRQEPHIRTVKGMKEVLNRIKSIPDYIELEKNIYLIYNCNGKNENLDFNRIIKDDVICGTAVIIKHNLEELQSLTPEEIKKYRKQFNLRRYAGMLEFCRVCIKESRNLLDLNLKGIEEKAKHIKLDKEYRNMKGLNKNGTKRRK